MKGMTLFASALLLLLCPTCARTPTNQSTRLPPAASYTFGGEVIRAQTRLAVDSQSTGGSILVYATLSAGSVNVREGYVEATYATSVVTPQGPFLLQQLSYSYALYNDTTRVYTLEFNRLHGELTHSKHGGYAASFAGTYDGRAPVLTEVQVLNGQFQQVRNVRDLRK